MFLISSGLYTLEPRVRVWFFHLLVLAQGLRATRRDGGHRSLQFVRNLIVGHRMKLSEGNWQKEIDPTINLIPEAKPHLSRYLSSERLKFQRDKFVTKAWWSFKDGWDFILNLFSQPPLSACSSLCWKHYQQSGKTAEVDKIQNKSDTMERHSMYFNGKQTSTHIHYFHCGILWALH